jgi:ribosomal protein S18 acetylase RimI-like enzyme
MTFSLRAPGPRDAPEIAEVHVTTWREAYGHLLPEGYLDDDHVRGRHEMWTRLLASPRDDRPVRIAERDGRVIGLAVAGPSIATAGEEPPRERQLYMLYVLAAEYGTGAGQALLDAVLADGPAQLWVAKENPRAIAFYRRNGFEFDGAEQHDPLAPAIVDARMVR